MLWKWHIIRRYVNFLLFYSSHNLKFCLQANSLRVIEDRVVIISAKDLTLNYYDLEEFVKNIPLEGTF